MTDRVVAHPSRREDLVRIERLVDQFFAAFSSAAGVADRLDALRSAFLPGAQIVRGGGEALSVMDVDAFIDPRAALLSSGALVDFSEWAVDGRIELFGDIAHWFGRYAKTGRLDGEPYDGAGMKSLQFVRTGEGWRISAAAWDDERSGLDADDHCTQPHPA